MSDNSGRSGHGWKARAPQTLGDGVHRRRSLPAAAPHDQAHDTRSLLLSGMIRVPRRATVQPDGRAAKSRVRSGGASVERHAWWSPVLVGALGPVLVRRGSSGRGQVVRVGVGRAYTFAGSPGGNLRPSRTRTDVQPAATTTLEPCRAPGRSKTAKPFGTVGVSTNGSRLSLPTSSPNSIPPPCDSTARLPAATTTATATSTCSSCSTHSTHETPSTSRFGRSRHHLQAPRSTSRSPTLTATRLEATPPGTIERAAVLDGRCLYQRG